MASRESVGVDRQRVSQAPQHDRHARDLDWSADSGDHREGSLRGAPRCDEFSHASRDLRSDPARRIQARRVSNRAARDLRAKRGSAMLWFTLGAHRILFSAMMLVVGWSHRSVLTRGGSSPMAFRRACTREFARDLAAMDPRRNAFLREHANHEAAESSTIASAAAVEYHSCVAARSPRN
jgi:hypothetical protein